MSPQRTARSQEVRNFLVTRRAKVTPEQTGLPQYGGTRRVPGLRREEVAMLAGVSVDYYTRLEKGNIAGASENILDAICTALQLDEAERVYLFDLARAANAANPDTRRSRPVGRPVRLNVRAGVQQILDGMAQTPAFIRNGRLDIVATNVLGRALYAPIFDSPTRTSANALPNLARFRFLDPAARDFYPDFNASAGSNVQLLRAEGARNPHDKGFTDLIGELCTRSEDFRIRWASHDVRLHHNGIKLFHHPIVGELRLHFEAFDLPADPGLTLTALSAPADSPAADGLKLLASWALSQTDRSTNVK
ncbi:helix-turn-helix transcriptional regulator [Polymorphospora rubra]|uniref:Transcriptional regulator n=1 Tax=Polymorphospora rubra TaxID=338584 RepID=A0A810N7Q3_9ACTN|nr:helix-turn-helix transcriptional regulator [Polymorphospora rubra]BCJ69426.1 transcriptional regulator [Polymorphospora rubra]